MFGIDEIYDSLLMEAKSPEEIRKILQYQFVDGKGVPQEIFEKILNEDPTKKKTFTKWVLMQWEKEHTNIISALKEGRLSDMFKYYQERANTGLNLLNMKSFTEALNAVPSSKIDPIFNIKPEEKELPENNFDIVYDSPEWRIAIPNTVEASEKLGRGCKWCTAGAYGNAKHYFSQYTKKGKLWVNFDKRNSEIGVTDNIEYPYTRYQFCFEANSEGELQDAENDRIDFDSMDMPENVLEFYRNENEDYYDSLIYSSDNDENIQRRNQRRLNNCILRKDCNDIDVSLLMLPSNDEDYSDKYQMYSDDDITDPLDNSLFNGVEDIIDTCEGFPLVVMKIEDDWSYDDALAVYYVAGGRLTITSPVRYFWRTSKKIDLYGGNEKHKYFIDDYNEYLYVAFGPNASDTVTEQFFINEEISKVSELRLKNLPEEYTSGTWLLYEFYNDFYGIIYIDDNAKEIKTIVEKDMPLADEGFYVVEENGNYYIQGRFKKHLIKGEHNNESLNNLKIVKAFNEEERYFIVSYEDLDKPSLKAYGIYDTSNKELILKDAEEIDDIFGAAIIKYTNYTVIYDFKKREMVSEPGVNYKVISDRILSTFKYNPLSNRNAIKIFNSDNMVDCGPFEEVLNFVSFDKICVIVNGEKRIYDLEANKFITPEGSNFIEKISNYLFTYTVNGRGYLYNCLRDEIVDEIDLTYDIKPINTNLSILETQYIYKKPNKKYNIANTQESTILPYDVDKIININGQDNKTYGFIINNKVFFLYEDKIMPSKNGIPSNNVLGCAIPKDLFGKGVIIVYITLNNAYYKVVYSLSQNKITNILRDENGTINVVDDANKLKEIENIFFPEKVQISENFKNIINRMNDL